MAVRRHQPLIPHAYLGGRRACPRCRLGGWWGWFCVDIWGAVIDVGVVVLGVGRLSFVGRFLLGCMSDLPELRVGEAKRVGSSIDQRLCGLSQSRLELGARNSMVGSLMCGIFVGGALAVVVEAREERRPRRAGGHGAAAGRSVGSFGLSACWAGVVLAGL